MTQCHIAEWIASLSTLARCYELREFLFLIFIRFGLIPLCRADQSTKDEPVLSADQVHNDMYTGRCHQTRSYRTTDSIRYHFGRTNATDTAATGQPTLNKVVWSSMERRVCVECWCCGFGFFPRLL